MCNMKITGAILTKNNYELTVRAIRSIMPVTDSVLLVDDYSNDGSYELLRSTFPNIRILQRKMNGDFSSQRNYAIQASENDWVLMIDSDEYLSEELVDNIFRVNFENADILYWACRENLSISGPSIEKYKDRPILFHKNNRFHGKLHERIKNQTTAKLRKISGYLVHDKKQTVERLIADLELYSKLKYEKNQHKSTFFKYRMLTLSVWTLLKYLFLRVYLFKGIDGVLYAIMSSITPVLAALRYIENKKSIKEK